MEGRANHEPRRSWSFCAPKNLGDCVVRLTLAMDVSLAEFERVEKILDELKGNEATHGRAGVLQVHRGELGLNTGQLEDLEGGLPEVLKSVVQRLQARAGSENGAIARQALYHLYKTYNGARRTRPRRVEQSQRHRRPENCK
jgi:hypothetical protein